MCIKDKYYIILQTIISLYDPNETPKTIISAIQNCIIKSKLNSGKIKAQRQMSPGNKWLTKDMIYSLVIKTNNLYTY